MTPAEPQFLGAPQVQHLLATAGHETREIAGAAADRYRERLCVGFHPIEEGPMRAVADHVGDLLDGAATDSQLESDDALSGGEPV
jgi:hypothetical protein